MATKRKYEDLNIEQEILGEKKIAFKHTLDSDEEDDESEEERYNVMSEKEVLEGAESAPTAPETNVGFTAFNMTEELEEGHFDKDGHYHWNKEKEIRDSWLDSLDNLNWAQIAGKPPQDSNEKQSQNNDDSDSDDDGRLYDPNTVYKQIIEYLQPGESVSKALRRLGKGKKPLTNAERWKRKKDPNAAKEDESSQKIIKLTELANELLTKTGNMDIYEETYEQIKSKLEQAQKHSKDAELDMYADDFEEKEKEQKEKGNKEENGNGSNNELKEVKVDDAVTWELKWSQDEGADIHGPHTSEEMQAWSKEGYFKKGAWVRRLGQQEFYSASRIDFELYCD